MGNVPYSHSIQYHRQLHIRGNVDRIELQMKIFHQLPKLQCEQLLSQITHFVILILVTDKFQQILSWQPIANIHKQVGILHFAAVVTLECNRWSFYRNKLKTCLFRLTFTSVSQHYCFSHCRCCYGCWPPSCSLTYQVLTICPLEDTHINLVLYKSCNQINNFTWDHKWCKVCSFPASSCQKCTQSPHPEKRTILGLILAIK